MAEIKRQDTDVLLTGEQLKKLDGYQSWLAELQAELDSCAAEYRSVIDRHYFNRENGFLDDQQKNLREIVVLQQRIEKLAGSLGDGSKELKSFMMNLQQSIHGDLTGQAPAGPEAAGEAVAEVPSPAGEQEPAQAGAEADEQASKPPAPAAADTAGAADKLKDTLLVIRGGGELMDEKTQGGEISIRRFIEELGLRLPNNRDTLYQINTQLKELLYSRKLIGYSATSLVFGRDKTLIQLFEDLQPIFLSDALRELLVQSRHVARDELDSVRLACDKQRELIFLVP
ncbi:MAG: hypothetical protein JXQ83_12705 [Candidatus Glassbacteria bacterium]|nr:hypothetical protein [Candidatus Glassbacteria bacterium]